MEKVLQDLHDDDEENKNNAGLTGWDAVKAAGYFALNPIGYVASRAIGSLVDKNPYKMWVD